MTGQNIIRIRIMAVPMSKIVNVYPQVSACGCHIGHVETLKKIVFSIDDVGRVCRKEPADHYRY